MALLIKEIGYDPGGRRIATLRKISWCCSKDLKVAEIGGDFVFVDGMFNVGFDMTDKLKEAFAVYDKTRATSEQHNIQSNGR